MRKTTILIVDDTPANLELLEGLLDEQGFEVHTAISGENALRSLETYHPDIILLDVMMPGLDGYETCRRIREDKSLPNIPILFLSAKGETADKVKGFQAGGNDYLTKPFEFEEVLVRIKHHFSYYLLQNELEKTKRFLDQVHDIAKIGTWVIDPSHKHILCDAPLCSMLELTKPTLTIEAFCTLFYGKDVQRLHTLFEEAINLGMNFSLEFHREQDNVLRTYEILAQVNTDTLNKELTINGSIQDITDKASQRDEIKINLDMINKHVITSKTDAKGIITYASEAFSEISGYKKEELMGHDHNIVRHPDMPDNFFSSLWSTISEGKPWHGEIKNRRKDGSFYWVDTRITPQFDYKGQITGYMAVRTDITNEKKIKELSITDQLTGLFNRRHFSDMFPVEIVRTIRHETFLAFIMLDVDFFKPYNDTYGHQAGDTVLTSIGLALKKTLQRKDDSVYRLGGEEFGVLCSVKHPKDIETMLEEIRHAIESLNIKHEKNTASKYITASFGSVCVDYTKKENYDISIDTLYKLADDELYKAKEAGRNQFSVHYL